MKTIIAFAIICLFSANAFVFPKINAADAKVDISTDINQYTEYEAIAGFIRGYIAALGLGSPKDVIYCYDQPSAVAAYNNLYGVSTISANTNSNTVISATANYWANISNRLYDKFSPVVLACISNSGDFKAITGALGVDPTSDAFASGLAKSLSEGSTTYQLFENAIFGHLISGNFDTAGARLATYHKFVAKSL